MGNLIQVKNLDEYYAKLNIGVSMSKMWNTLQSKAEYSSNRSEKGYQQVAKTMAGNISSARAIRKTALACLLRLHRCFPYIQALISSADRSPDPYASINLSNDLQMAELSA